MKSPTKRKLKKHDRPRWRYLLFSRDDAESAKKELKNLKVNFKEVELIVQSLRERQRGRVILKVNRDEMKKIKLWFEDRGINPANVSGTLKGLLNKNI